MEESKRRSFSVSWQPESPLPLFLVANKPPLAACSPLYLCSVTKLQSWSCAFLSKLSFLTVKIVTQVQVWPVLSFLQFYEQYIGVGVLYNTRKFALYYTHVIVLPSFGCVVIGACLTYSGYQVGSVLCTCRMPVLAKRCLSIKKLECFKFDFTETVQFWWMCFVVRAALPCDLFSHIDREL